MAKVYALLEFTDPSGDKHEIGDEFDLPRETDREKADFERLIDEGVITRSESKANPETSETDPPQRSRRRKD